MTGGLQRLGKRLVNRTDRCGLADGSRLNINIYQKAADKAALSIQHEKLESEAQVEFWRSYWKGRLAAG